MLNRLGLCAPSSCSNAILAEATQRYWHKRTLLALDLFNVSAEVVRVRSSQLSNFYQKPDVQWLAR